MTRPRIVASDPAGLESAVDSLDAGEVVALPTDTLYALAASTRVDGASSRIFGLKRRGREVPLPVLCADLGQARTVGLLTGDALELARAHWPGPLTLVVERAAGFVADIGDSRGTVGLRVSDDPVTRAVAAQAGPLATSSANLHGEPEPHDPEAIAALFGTGVSLVVRRAGGTHGSGLASTVLRCGRDGRILEVLRQGTIEAG